MRAENENVETGERRRRKENIRGTRPWSVQTEKIIENERVVQREGCNGGKEKKRGSEGEILSRPDCPQEERMSVNGGEDWNFE